MPIEITPSSSDPALATYGSPIGRLTLAARGGALVGLWVVGQRFFGCPVGMDEADARVLRAAASWLDDYFAGKAPSPAAVRLAPAGTDFQRHVWEAMATIPYGATRTYGQIVGQLWGAGIPASAQAVGGAVGRNPLLLILPCHRVVAASGPGGYAAGGHAKAWLLAHEAATASSVS